MKNSKIIIAFSVLLLFAIVLWKWPKKQLEMQMLPVAIQDQLLSQPEIIPQSIEVVENSEQIKIVQSTSSDADLPKEVNLVAHLFNPHSSLLPIVECVSFVSRVPWLPNRPAYLGDWAHYYETSKHFISRSLNGLGGYLNEKVSRGDRFNVFRKDKQIEFHLVLDLSRLKLWLYYLDVALNERVLLKSYPVCAGELVDHTTSGSLTPLGLFEIGKDLAIYKEGMQGLYKGSPAEMITIFGVRWIPLVREIAGCTAACKGLGLHGIPWERDPESGQLVEKRECIGGYNSQGCIRFLTEDIEEIFSIITTKPSYLHIVRDFQEAKLPGTLSRLEN